VTTKDGYVLQLFRVYLSDDEFSKLTPKQKLNRERPVLFMHGVIGDAGQFLPNEDKSSAFFLIKNGFDCWFGNNRGNKFAQTTIDNRNAEKFWDFSFEDMGLKDTPEIYHHI